MNDLISRLRGVVGAEYRPDPSCVPAADALLRHELSVLGSAPARAYYGMSVPGFEGYAYPHPEDAFSAVRREADAAAPAYADRMQRAETLAQTYVTEYEPIPWHMDIKTGYVYALDWHTRVPVARFPGVDAKTPSDMSRGHNLLTLAQSWRFTGNRRYRSEAAAQLLDWLSVNPPYYGPAWRNGMNVAVRTVNIICAAALLELEPADASDAAFLELLRETLEEHRRFISLTLECYRPHNHVTAELAGLTLVTAMLSEDESTDPAVLENRAWERIAWRDLNNEAARQIREDGFDFENSTSYHAYVLEMLLYPALHAARVKGCRTAEEARAFLLDRERFSAVSLENIRRAARVLRLITQPDGTIPYIGDNDAGRYLEWETRDRNPADMRALSCIAAVLFDDPTLLPDCIGDSDFTAAKAFFEAVKPMRPAYTPNSAALTDCGYTVMARDGFHCVFRSGGTHDTGDGGHCNNDQLAVTLCVNGKTILVDPGTYTYTGDAVWRARLRSLNAHGTVAVDGEETDRTVSLSAFGGGGTETHTRLTVFRESAESIVCAGTHNGFYRLPDMLSVTRTLTYRDNCLYVKDSFCRSAAAPEHGEIVERFIAHPDCIVSIENGSAALERKDVRVEFHSDKGRFRAEPAIFSPTYGIRRDTTALCVVLSRDCVENTVTICWAKP